MRSSVAEHPDVDMRLALRARLVGAQKLLDRAIARHDQARSAEEALHDLRVRADVVAILFRLHVLLQSSSSRYVGM